VIAIAPGDPGGIGPALIRRWIAAAADGDLAGVAVAVPVSQAAEWRDATAGRVEIHVSGDTADATFAPRYDAANGRASFACLERALDLAIAAGSAGALVTGPIAKESLRAAGLPYLGHTPYLEARGGGARALMSFYGGAPRGSWADPLAMALMTHHLPLAQVPAKLAAIGMKGIASEIVRFVHGIAPLLANVPVAILGLNPHAGEEGLLGTEDRDLIAPAIGIARTLLPGVELRGPLPADTAMTPSARAGGLAVVAMYHDQGLAPFKSLCFESACQVTLGLPFIRTSVDHGTAFDLVREGPAGIARAHGGSLDSAIHTARRLIAARTASLS
jgi:4-hydroxythreonine-4-phosphate dehydrogenase